MNEPPPHLPVRQSWIPATVPKSLRMISLQHQKRQPTHSQSWRHRLREPLLMVLHQTTFRGALPNRNRRSNVTISLFRPMLSEIGKPQKKDIKLPRSDLRMLLQFGVQIGK